MSTSDHGHGWVDFYDAPRARYKVATEWVVMHVRYYTRNEDCRCGDCATLHASEWDGTKGPDAPWIAGTCEEGDDAECVDCGRSLPAYYGGGYGDE